MPTLRSMCHGGISRAETRVLIELAQGRTSSYVRNDIGADCPGRWQVTHDRWRIGATSFVNVTCGRVWAEAGPHTSITPARLEMRDAAWKRRELSGRVLKMNLHLMPESRNPGKRGNTIHVRRCRTRDDDIEEEPLRASNLAARAGEVCKPECPICKAGILTTKNSTEL